MDHRYRPTSESYVPLRSSPLNPAAQPGDPQEESLAEQLRRERQGAAPSGCVQEFEDYDYEDDDILLDYAKVQKAKDESGKATSIHPLLRLDTDVKLVRFAMQEPTLRRWLVTGKEVDRLAAEQWLKAQRVDEAVSDSTYRVLALLRQQHEQIIAALSPAARVNGDPATWSTQDKWVLDRMKLVLWFGIYHSEVCDDLKKAANRVAGQAKLERQIGETYADAVPLADVSNRVAGQVASTAQTHPSPPKPDKVRLRRVALQAAAARNAAQSFTVRESFISNASAESKPVRMLNIRPDSVPAVRATSTPAPARQSNDRSHPAGVSATSTPASARQSNDRGRPAGVSATSSPASARQTNDRGSPAGVSATSTPASARQSNDRGSPAGVSATSTPASARQSEDRGRPARPAARPAQAISWRVHIRPTATERQAEAERAAKALEEEEKEALRKEEDARKRDEWLRSREQAAREREGKTRRSEETKRHMDKWFSEQAEWNRKERAREAREATRQGQEPREDVVLQTEQLLETLRAESAQNKTMKAEQMARRVAERAPLGQRGSKRLHETWMVQPDENLFKVGVSEQARRVQAKEEYRREDEKRDKEAAQLEKRIRHLEEVLGLVRAQREKVRLTQDADAGMRERKALRVFEEWLSEGGLKDV